MTTLNVTNLDFEGIKTNLKAWMKANPEFTDYDFEASGLSFLTDVLAYNTHYNAVLANFMANEMFLDTALKRNSVLSHAKALGYRSRGYSAARAKIKLVISETNSNTPPSLFILRRGTAFSTAIGDNYFQFVTTQDYVAPLIDNKYTFESLEIVEGIFNIYAWKLSDDISYKYLIPNVRTDNSTIKMHVYPNATATNFDEWSRATSILVVDNTSKVFFTQETDKNYTEFYFGNDAVGMRPAAGSVIKLEYVSCNGLAGNGAKLFNPFGTISHDGGLIEAKIFNISLVEESNGGLDAESTNEIKYNASNHFAMQNRAVTASDYVALIREGFTNVEDIKVWGGEEAVQKQYGVVFVCIKPHVGSYLTRKERDEITALLQSRSIMGMKVKFVDPEYTDIVIRSNVKYDIDKRDSNIDLEGVIKDEILRYSDDSLESFGKAFRYSNLCAVIDQANPSIISNSTSVMLYKSQTPILGRETNYVLSFYNPLASGNNTIQSSAFWTPDHSESVRIVNRGSVMVMGYYNPAGKFVILREVGAVDFTNGVVTLNKINVLQYDGDVTHLLAIPEFNDLYSKENNILRIQSSNVTITTALESVK